MDSSIGSSRTSTTRRSESAEHEKSLWEFREQRERNNDGLVHRFFEDEYDSAV